MLEKPKISVTRARRDSATKNFSFTANSIPLDGLKDVHSKAWDVFSKFPMPITTDEAWRRTDLRLLPVSDFKIPTEGAFEDLPEVPAQLLLPLTSEKHGGQITLLPGGSQVNLDPDLASKGIIFTDFRTAQREHPELLNKLIGTVVKPEDGKFAALASALAENGVLLYVPKNLKLETPLHSILWGPGVDMAYFSHLIVYIDNGASATYVHEAASPNESGHAMHAGVVELHVGEDANLRFVELQSWGRHVWNFSHERARVERGGNLDWIFGAVGSRLTKNFSDLDLVGQGAQGRMSGFYFTDGTQHLDHDTQQNHLAPQTTSDLLFKGALKGKSRSVWQGMIYVAPNAKKTDGYQANRNLVLDSQARADSIPGLEILADDVRCTHGATVGKLEKEPLFYLESRGLQKDFAERLMVEGFFDPIMQRIPFEGVRERFQQAIKDKLSS